MNTEHPIHRVMSEHAPRGSDDPCYVPWWAKGGYARRNGTKYTTEEGSTVEAGRVVTEGHGRRSEGERLPEYRPQAQNATEGRGKATARVPRAPDEVRQMLQDNPSRQQRVALCHKWGIDPGLLDNAPNAGVATMRLANALRRKMAQE